jgi:preprotein translocase subunit SecG
MLVRFLLGFAVVFSSLFLIALVLIQRGRGGGLAGALGGMGGQSAFGTKAGDVFTRITVIAASCWIMLCILALNVLGPRDDGLLDAKKLGGANAVAPVEAQIQPADKATPDGEAANPDADVQPSDEAAPVDATKSTPPAADAKPADGSTATDSAPPAPAAPAN